MPEFNGPDPISQLGGPGLGKQIMEGLQYTGDFLVACLEGACNKIAGAAMSVGGAALTAVASATNAVTSKAAPYIDGIVASSSPGKSSPEIEPPSRGKSLEVEGPSFASLGNLSAPATPSMGISAGQGRSV